MNCRRLKTKYKGSLLQCSIIRVDTQKTCICIIDRLAFLGSICPLAKLPHQNERTMTETTDSSSSQGGRAQPQDRSGFRAFRTIGTRWSDNDIYGHVNNVVYYSWFDTAINGYLIERGALDIHAGETIGLVVETQCSYFSSLAFPQVVEAGLRVSRIGSSSVRYEIGLFAQGEAKSAAAGHFVHVYVDRQTRRPAALPHALREALDALRV